MKQASFNGMDSNIEPKTGYKRRTRNIQPPLQEGCIISLVKWFGIESFVPVDEQGFLYKVIGMKYRRNSRKRVYLLQPSIMNTLSTMRMREVEDSVKLYVWNEQKQKWQTRTDYAESVSGDEKTA